MKASHYLLFLTSASLLGCQSTPRLPVPTDNPPVVVVQNAAESHQGKTVTWGGVILETHTKPKYTEIIVLSKRLSRSTRPLASDDSLGRFIAQVDGFLDPALYTKNREITVHGKIARMEKRQVGDFNYHYPVILVDQHYLWQPRPKEGPYDPFWYDPWYGPWYYPYPYHHSHRHIRAISEPK